MSEASHIRLSSVIDGYRRGGIAHSVEPKTYLIEDLSAAQLEQLKADPRISVEFVTLAAQADPADDATGAVDIDSVEVDLNSLTVEQLKEVAAAGGVDGYKSMKKAELIQAIEEARDVELVVEPDESEA